MKFRNIDSGNDWSFGKGKQSYVRDNDALMLNVKTRVQSFVNDCFFDTDAGVDWFNLLGSKDQENIIAAVQKVIIETEGVTKINTIDFYTDSVTRNLQVTYNINTQYTTNVEAVQEILP